MKGARPSLLETIASAAGGVSFDWRSSGLALEVARSAARVPVNVPLWRGSENTASIFRASQLVAQVDDCW